MSATLVIGNKNYSSWSLRPWLLLRHNGVAFEEVRLPLDTPEFEARVGDWSPSRRVPVLRDGELTVWDSLAICEYANERWLGGAGWPDDPALRALARSASCEMHSGFAALRAQLPMNLRRPDNGHRGDAACAKDIARVQQLWCDLRGRSHGDGDFLTGRFGIADAMFAPVCFRFRGYGIALDAVSSSYVEAMLALPAMREWDAAGKAELERVAADEV
jgi:glutathione S-transferase